MSVKKQYFQANIVTSERGAKRLKAKLNIVYRLIESTLVEKNHKWTSDKCHFTKKNKFQKCFDTLTLSYS